MSSGFPTQKPSLSGWLFASLALALWMVPRALDAAVTDAGMAAAKFASMLVAGLAFRLSWPMSAAVVQLFFMGNWAWMTATVGMLYLDAPQRLCNAYLQDEQIVSGYGLIGQAILLPLTWAWLQQRRGR